ncbi:hypothetical protein Esti_000466 [Eimeria stiedai]
MRLEQQQPVLLLLLLLLLPLQGQPVCWAAAEQLTSGLTPGAEAAAAAGPAATPRLCSLTASSLRSPSTAAAAAAAPAADRPYNAARKGLLSASLGLRGVWGRNLAEEATAAAAAKAAAAAEEEKRRHAALLQRAKRAALMLQQQVAQQLRQREPELRVVWRSLGRLALQCIGSLLRMHSVSASLLLPLCNSWGFAEPLARVKLDDPFLLQQLQLPAGATPALFGLRFEEVSIPSVAVLTELKQQQQQQQQQRQQQKLQEEAEDAFVELQQEGAAQSLQREQQQRHQQQQHEQQRQQQQQQQLRGWLIPAQQRSSRKAIICLHGWLSNRQGCLPFLSTAHELKLHQDHHILLLDLRGSGESPGFRDAAAAAAAGAGGGADAAAAAAGWGVSGTWSLEGALCHLARVAQEDLRTGMLFLKTQLGASEIGVYAQGGAAMGLLLLAGTEAEWLQSEGLRLEGLLLDSPLCSPRLLLQEQRSVPAPLRSALLLLQHLSCGFGSRRSAELRRLRESLSLGSLASSKAVVILSKGDPLHTWHQLQQQLLLLDDHQLPQATYVVESGSHCNLAAANAAAFEAAAAEAFSTPGLLQRLMTRLWGPASPRLPADAQRLAPSQILQLKQQQQQQVQLHQQQLLQHQRQVSPSQHGTSRLASNSSSSSSFSSNSFSSSSVRAVTQEQQEEDLEASDTFPPLPKQLPQQQLLLLHELKMGLAAPLLLPSLPLPLSNLMASAQLSLAHESSSSSSTARTAAARGRGSPPHNWQVYLHPRCGAEQERQRMREPTRG